MVIKTLIFSIPLLLISLQSFADSTTDATIGGALGGTAGAAIGNELGGRNKDYFCPPGQRKKGRC